MESKDEIKNKKNSLVEQIGRSIQKARRAICSCEIDADKLLGDEDKGTIHMISKVINLTDGQEKEYATSLRQNAIDAKKKINEKSIEKAITYLDEAIMNFAEMKKNE